MRQRSRAAKKIPPKKILVVDDEPQVAETIRMVLAYGGHTVRNQLRAVPGCSSCLRCRSIRSYLPIPHTWTRISIRLPSASWSGEVRHPSGFSRQCRNAGHKGAGGRALPDTRPFMPSVPTAKKFRRKKSWWWMTSCRSPRTIRMVLAYGGHTVEIGPTTDPVRCPCMKSRKYDLIISDFAPVQDRTAWNWPAPSRTRCATPPAHHAHHRLRGIRGHGRGAAGQHWIFCWESPFPWNSCRKASTRFSPLREPRPKALPADTASIRRPIPGDHWGISPQCAPLDSRALQVHFFRTLMIERYVTAQFVLRLQQARLPAPRRLQESH